MTTPKSFDSCSAITNSKFNNNQRMLKARLNTYFYLKLSRAFKVKTSAAETANIEENLNFVMKSLNRNTTQCTKFNSKI